MTLLFYDWEVFKYDNLVVIIDPEHRKELVFVNDTDGFHMFYEDHKNDIWIGYNSRNYDQYISKAALCGFNLKEVNDFIIVQGKKGFQYSSLFRKFPIIDYDVTTGFHGLKQLEGFMGNDIRETSVPFNIDRPLTKEEIAETIKYCRHDVEQTIEVFFRRKARFDAQLALVKTFGLPLSYISKTQAQLAAVILGAKTRRVTYNDEWDIRMPETLKLGKYAHVAEWFLNKRNHDVEAKLDCMIAGVPHVVAWGGIHGAISEYHYTCKDDELLIMADVDQLYPTLMVRYHLLSRAVQEYQKFENILATSLRLKAEKKKKERQPYKDICNITYGAEGDAYNPMYDPLHRRLVCVYGQVLIVDLIEKIEGFCELIQSNTDGILIKIKKDDFDKLDDAVYEWEERTGLHMSFDLYKRIVQKDVNNYIAVDLDGNIKSKGGYVKELSDLDNDLPIVNKAIVDYFVHGIVPHRTISECNDLMQFQKIVRVSSKYSHGVWNGQRLNDKTFRVFASKRPLDGFIGKCKSEVSKPEKFANTPDRCFIWNESVIGVPCPDYLDKLWYIDLAETRIKQFGQTV
ncbi:MAG: hypothetical protein MJY71_08100 [Bacteroidaceae bacterium]|nr:hypothetical protein [Bacteroidaceae bacterium]